MADRWPEGTLVAIDRADDLAVAPLRPDGRTYGTPTWVWCVAVDGELYVRAYHGVRSRWHAAALAQPDGRIRAAGNTYAVTFESVAASQLELMRMIDDAYRSKYAADPFMGPMISQQARAATVRIRLRR